MRDIFVRRPFPAVQRVERALSIPPPTVSASGRGVPPRTLLRRGESGGRRSGQIAHDHHRDVRRRGQRQLIGLGRFASTACQVVSSSKPQAGLAAIVESSDDAMVGEDLDGVIQNWNAGAGGGFGDPRPRKQWAACCGILFPADRLNENTSSLDRVRQVERVRRCRNIRRRDSSLVDISLSVSPIVDAQGRDCRRVEECARRRERERLDEALNWHCQPRTPSSSDSHGSPANALSLLRLAR